jgi:Universal stress protein family
MRNGAHSPESSCPACGPVLALLDRNPRDAGVLARALAVAAEIGSGVLLMHVTSPPPRGANFLRRLLEVEELAMADLRRWQARLASVGYLVEIDDVYFGDAAQEVERAAARCGAQVVVAAARPRRWISWLSRDRQLARRLNRPLLLVKARSMFNQARPAAGWRGPQVHRVAS